MMVRVYLGVVAVVFAVGCNTSRAATQAPLPPGEVWLGADEITRAGIEAEPVALHDVDDVLVTSGRIAFDESRVAHVVSPVNGEVVRIDGQLGAHVKRGEPLAIIRSPDVGDATSDWNKAHADRIAAEHEYDRQQAMYSEKATTLEALQQADDAWRTAKAEEERASLKVKLLHASPSVSQYYPLTSPIDGVILARNITPGVQLQGAYSGGSNELFTVGDLQDVWVFADAYETDLARVHAGARVEVTFTGAQQPFEGKLDYVSDMLDPQTRTARMRCTIQNPTGQLKPEMYVTVRVSVAPTQALAVPRSAILHLGGTTLVFVERGPTSDKRTRFERLPITADETGSGPWVPVSHGLDRGDRVVVKGVEALSSKL